MNWVERIMNSDAAKGNPEAAKRLVKAAGGESLLLEGSSASGLGEVPTAAHQLPPTADD